MQLTRPCEEAGYVTGLCELLEFFLVLDGFGHLSWSFFHSRESLSNDSRSNPGRVDVNRPSMGLTAPPETMSFIASSTGVSISIVRFFGTISINPEVGFGVVGTKTLMQGSPTNSDIPAASSFVTNATTHIPSVGYGTSTARRNNRLRLATIDWTIWLTAL